MGRAVFRFFFIKNSSSFSPNMPKKGKVSSVLRREFRGFPLPGEVNQNKGKDAFGPYHHGG
jgi:hypothetical protein